MEADETLKQQFKLLQDQQQLKLLRRKQMKEEKENSSNNSTKNKSFGIDDNLDLKIEKNLGSNYISEELVEHLNNQIRELRDENGRCYKLLSEREFEIKQLKKKKIEEKSALSGVEVTNETAATKIVELSKKVRELTSELESEKTKNKQIGKKCHDLQTQISSIPEEARNTFGSASTFRSIYSDNDREQAELDVKALQDKLKQTEAKVAEFRNQSSQLKQDLKIAHKVLNQEVGENVNIQSLLSGNTNWRGRAQQILLLQKKVDELKQQVSPSKSRDEDDLENELMGRTTSSTRRRTQDDKYREELRKYDKEKKEAQEKLVNEFKALENDHTALKSKMEAAKARNKVLATEMKSIKQQMATLLEKGKNDDELIQALMRQQSQLKEMLDTSNSHQKQNNLNQQDMLNELSIKSQQDHNIVEQLKTIVAEKEFKVHRLEEEINSLKLQHLQKIQDEGRSNISNTSRPFTSTNHDNLVLQSVTPPGTGSRRDERPPTVAGRVESARSLPSRSSVRPPSASHVSSNQETEALQYQCQEYKILMQTADVEKEKLAELVKILQKRIEEAVLKHNESQTELINQRRNNALLEKQLAKYKVDQNKFAKGNTSARKKGLSSGRIGGDPIYKSLDDETDVQSLEEIQTCLEIQKDENEALKSALHSTLQAKEEDLRIYSNTIDETKKVLLQALRQYKQNIVQH
ncbi:hypothetical protein SNE40_008710 [Patella caerulea]|uniref:Coiled-coil domain-containing protein 13 n=1 Tax=Patella caerulea TaxID=87958 RepID=A0AAN8JTL2_PATCE